MVPLKLTLSNFMSYGTPPEILPLNEIHVACLSGDNGHGKSAIMDAITWVLWGKTRLSSTEEGNDDNLIRLGADKMEVVLEFTTDDGIFQISRRKKRGKTPSQQDWKLEEKLETGEWIKRSSKLGETQDQIKSLIHLDYDTFLNSAYLKQGQADMFTNLKPAARIDVLRDILGISRYDKLSSMAVDRSRELQTDIQDYSVQIKTLESQIADSPDINALNDLSRRYVELETQIEQLNSRTSTLKDSVSKLLILQQDTVRLNLEIERLLPTEKQLLDKQSSVSEKLALTEKLLASKSAIEQDYAMLQAVSAEILTLEPQLDQLQANRNDQNALASTIKQEQIKLEAELNQLKTQIAHQSKQSSILAALQKQIDECSAIIKREERSGILLSEAEKKYAEERDLFQAMKSRSDRLKEEMTEMQEVLDLLQKASGECPTCGADLEGELKQQVTNRQLEKQMRLKQEHDDLRAKGIETKKTINSLENEIKSLREHCMSANTATVRLKALSVQSSELQKSIQTLESDKKLEQTLETQLNKEMYAQPSRIKLKRIEKEIAELEQVENKLQTMRLQRDSLVPCMERFQQLKSADQDYSGTMAEFTEIMKDLQKVQTEIDTKHKIIKTLSDQLVDLPKLQIELKRTEDESKAVQKERDALNRQIGSIQTAVDAVNAARTTLKQKREQRKRIDEDRTTYIELARAFGPDGIQSYILETMLPEIEEEANSLLSRISGGEMSLSLTINQVSKVLHGKQKSTLEITISDALGTRPFEMFSGGEAFKISFALRISLSRLLASRSGARLKILILDEGFGSQDGKGRERLVEAIEAVKQDFEKILLITHLDDLKNAFSQRIEIYKDSTGSHIQLIA